MELSRDGEVELDDVRGGDPGPDPVRGLIRAVSDFPRPGTQFKDITPLLGDAAAFRHALDRLAGWAAPRRPAVVAAVDARGFIFGGALAAALGCGFVPVRKAGKLPGPVTAREFDGEYATDTLELHLDAFEPGTRVLVHDDVLATGHCAEAVAGMVESLGGVVVGLAFLVELAFLSGAQRIAQYEHFAVSRFE